MSRTARSVDLEALDRLEEKLKTLLATVTRLRAEQVQLAEDNRRLSGELESARARLAESDGQHGEFVALKEEREVVRTRVAKLLSDLEALNL